MQGSNSSLQQTKERNSNAELLRLICMFFIVVHHFIVHSIYPEVLQGKVSWDSEADLLIAQFLNAFCFIGVNCFILISGYFSIKLRWKGVVNLYLTCVLCFLVVIGIDYAATMILGKPYALNRTWEQFILIFSHHYGWFIPCYFILMIASPLLNTAINHLQKKEFTIIIVLFTILQIHFAYYWGSWAYGSNGYDIQHMVYMYLIGAYIQRYGKEYMSRSYRYKWLTIYVICSLMFGIMPLLNIEILHWRTFVYTNPILMVAAIAFFYFILSFNFQNRLINYLAKSAIAVYLIQEGLGIKGMYHLIGDISQDFAPWFTLGWLFFVSGGCFVGIIVLDQIRRFVQPHIEQVVLSISDKAVLKIKHLYNKV